MDQRKERERKTKKLLVGFLVLCCALNVARAENNCTGATYYDSNTDTCITCPGGYDYNTEPGKTDITQCQIHCDAGTWVSAEYTQLEYIESTGTQYIDTGISESSIDYIEMDFENKNSGGFMFVNGSTQLGVQDSRYGTTTQNTRYKIKQERSGSKWQFTNMTNGTVFQQPWNSGTYTLWLFRLNNNGTFASVKIYNFLCSTSGVLRCNFVPVRRNSDGVLGMYDMVSEQFFANAGTGEFIAGNDVGAIGGQCTDVGAGYYSGASTVNYGSVGTRTECPAGTYSNVTNASSCTPCVGATYNDETAQAACKSCPTGYDYNTDPGKTSETECQIHCDAGTYVEIPGIAGYTQLEYIESTGTQWIDTGVSFSSSIGYEFEYQPKNTNNFVVEANTTGQVIAQSGNVWEFRFNGSTNRRPNPATIDLTKFVNIKYNIDSKCSVDDNVVDISDLTLNNMGNIRLFGPNYSSSGRMKFFKIYSNGELIKNLRPVRRNSDGAIGMYDMVTQTFFTNAGTGTFIAGNDVGGQCVDVGAGYYVGASTVNYGSLGTRTACPAGTYSDNPNATSINDCAPCSGATYNDITAQAACKSCPAGYDYNTTPGKTDITQCQIHCNAGTYVEKPGIAGYTQLEYLESTGTQYIDTDTKFMYGDEFFFEYMPIASYSGEDKGYGAGSSGPVEISGGGRRVNGNVTVYMNGNYTYSPTLAYDNTLGKRYTEHWKIDNDTGRLNSILTDVSNDLTYTLTGPTYTSSYNSGNSVLLWNGPGGFRSRIRIYRTWLKRMDGTMAFDLVPVRRNSDGAIGMYDMVTQTFFTNAGTGTFIAGNDVGGQCVDVGAGYYVGASTVNYGSFGTRNACVAPTTTVGYGHGADEANDCGRILHIGDSFIYARRNKITTPSLNIRMENGDMFYISLSSTNHSVSRLHMQQGETKYTAYDDSLMYGERDFDTGEQIIH